MFRKLEEKRFGKNCVENGESQDADCLCACKSGQDNKSKTQPQSTSMRTKVGVHYDING
jgi:hypothetical protein